ncbi:MAG: glycoside hydrolase domain-containing protein, partial [Armatimonadota bacterium]
MIPIKHRVLCIAANILGMCSVVALFAQEAPAYEVHFPTATVMSVAKRPVVDGVITPGEWDSSTRVTGFCSIRTDMLVSDQTEAYMTVSGTDLYIACRCYQPGQPKANITTRDGNLWEDDSVEIFLQPDTSSPNYYQFIGNSKGTVYDLTGISQTETKDASWNGVWSYKSSIHKGYWECELCIPLSQFGITGNLNGRTVGLNIGRDFQSPGSTLVSSWALIKSWKFCDTISYARLILSDSGIVTRRFDINQSNNGKLSFLVELLNPVPFGSEASLLLEVMDDHKTVLTKRLEFNASESLRYSQNLPSGDYKVSMVLESKVGIVAAREYKIRVLSPLSLKRYFFHDKILPTLDLGADDAETCGRVVFSVQKREKVLLEKVASVSQKKVSATIDISSLPPGAYSLVAKAYNKNRKTVLNVSSGFDKPAKPVWFNSKVGVSDEVLPPWTPMSVHNSSVSCWGRTYTFANLPVPSQILNQESNMLASPIFLDAIVNGKKVKWQ